MAGPDVVAELLRLERALAERDPSGIEGGLMTLIAEDFVEIGRSGRMWTADTIRDVLDGPPGPVPIAAFEVTPLADDVALATYRTPGARRASIWVRRDGRWQIRFHQGTPVTD